MQESKLGKSLQRETTLEIYSSTEETRKRINSENYRNESKLNSGNLLQHGGNAHENKLGKLPQ